MRALRDADESGGGECAPAGAQAVDSRPDGKLQPSDDVY
jgi:hypothetical protein